jgi:hypothetical protein
VYKISRAALIAMAGVLFTLAIFSAVSHGQMAPQMVVRTVLSPKVDVFTGASQTETLTAAPSGVPMVYVNGLLMQAGPDYTLTGTALVFTGQDVADMDSPVVQVWYWAGQ